MFREGRGGSKAVLDISARKTCKMFKKCAKRAERAKVCKKWRSVQIYENLHTKNLQKYTKDWKKRAYGYERLQKNVQMCTIGCKKTCRCIRKVAKKPAYVYERLQKNLQMYTKGCKKTCRSIRKIERKKTCRCIRKVAKIVQKVQRFAKMCRSLLKFGKAVWIHEQRWWTKKL